jgi:hypothetical protein
MCHTLDPSDCEPYNIDNCFMDGFGCKYLDPVLVHDCGLIFSKLLCENNEYFNYLDEGDCIWNSHGGLLILFIYLYIFYYYYYFVFFFLLLDSNERSCIEKSKITTCSESLTNKYCENINGERCYWNENEWKCENFCSGIEFPCEDDDDYCFLNGNKCENKYHIRVCSEIKNIADCGVMDFEKFPSFDEDEGYCFWNGEDDGFFYKNIYVYICLF